MRDYYYDEGVEYLTCICGCPEGGSHVDHVSETLEPCGREGCAILLCGACKCPEHGEYRVTHAPSL
jgi:hypothetical protein